MKCKTKANFTYPKCDRTCCSISSSESQFCVQLGHMQLKMVRICYLGLYVSEIEEELIGQVSEFIPFYSSCSRCSRCSLCSLCSRSCYYILSLAAA